MKYDAEMVTEARDSGAGALFNYERHIALFVLSVNNCINFYIYLMSGSTWRAIFVSYLREMCCWCKNYA